MVSSNASPARPAGHPGDMTVHSEAQRLARRPPGRERRRRQRGDVGDQRGESTQYGMHRGFVRSLSQSSSIQITRNQAPAK